MAVQTVDIFLKIREKGLEAVDKLIGKLQELKTVTEETEAGPLKEVAEQAAKISESFEATSEFVENIDETTQNIEKILENVIKKVSRQAIDAASSSLGRMERTAAATIENFYSKAVVAFVGFIPLAMVGWSDSFNKFVFQVSAGTKTLGSTILSTFGTIYSTVSSGLTSLLETGNQLFHIYSGGMMAINQFFVSWFGWLGGIVGAYAQIIVSSAAFGASLFVVRTFLGEINVLFRRLLGKGTASINPLQRAVRLVTTLDLSFNQIDFRMGHFVKNLFLIGSTISAYFLNPILGVMGALATVNSFIDTLLALGLKLRLRFFAFFGDARAQTRLGLLEMRSALVKVVPQITSLVDNFGKLKKVGEQKGLLHTFATAQELLRELVRMISMLVTHIRQIGKLGVDQVEMAEKKAFEFLSGVDKKVEATFKKAKIGPGFFSRMVSGFSAAIGNIDRILGQTLRNIPGTFAGVFRNFSSIIGDVFKHKGPSVGQQLTAKTMDKTAESVKKLEYELVKVGRAIPKQAFEGFATAQEKIPQGAKVIVSAFRVVSTEIIRYEGSIKKAVQSIFTLDLVEKNLVRTLFAGVQPLIVHIFNFLSLSEAIAKTGESSMNLYAVFARLFNSMARFQQQYKTFMIDPDAYLKLSQALEMAFSRGFKIDRGKVRTVFMELEKYLNELASKGIVKGKDVGGKFVNLMATGIKEHRAEIEKVIALLAELIQAYLPSSPAKKGALRNLKRSAAMIPIYLVQGISSGLKAVGKAADNMGEEIAKRLPRSLPLVGPLVKIISMGFKIPYYIGVGIARGIKFVATAAGSMVAAIVKPVEFAIEKIQAAITGVVDMTRLAQRTGFGAAEIGSLDYALRTVGSSAQELDFVLMRLNDRIAEGFSEEESLKIQRLGLDIRAISTAANPALEMFYQISDVLAKFPPQSKEFRQALELIGLTASSKVINLLRKGSAEIQRLQKEAVKAGSVVTEEFAKSSIDFEVLIAKFKLFRENISRYFLQDILPELNSKLQDLFDFLLDNSIRIQAFFTLAGKAVLAIIPILEEFFKVMFTRPDVAWNILKTAFFGIIEFITKTLGSFYTNTGESIKDFFATAGSIALRAVTRIMAAVWKTIWKTGKVALPEIISALGRTIKYALGESLEETEARLEKVRRSQRKLLEYGLKDRGFYELKSQLKKIYDERIKLQEEIAKAANETVQAEMMIEEGMLAEQAQKISAQMQKIRRTIEKGIKKGEITWETEGLKKSLQRILDPSEFQQISESWENLWNSITSGANLYELEKNLELLKAKLAASAQDTKLPELFRKFLDVFSKEGREAALKAAEEFQAELKRRLERAGEDVGKPAGKSLGEGIRDGLAEALKSLPDVLYKTNRSIQLMLTKLRASISPEDMGLQKDVEMLELEARQEEEYKKFIELLQKKRDAEGFYRMEKLEQEEYLQAELDRIRSFKSLQETETIEKTGALERESLLKTLEMAKDVFGDFGNVMSELYELSGKKVKEFFYLSKAAAIAQATINIAQAITKAMADLGPLGIAKQAMVAAMGVVQIGKIISQTLEGYQTGGPVPMLRPGLTPGVHKGRDHQVVAVDGGEFFHPFDVVRHYGLDFMESVRRKVFPKDILHRLSYNLMPYVPSMPAYQAGGYVPTTVPGEAGAEAAMQPIQIVNIPDPSLVPQFMASNIGQKMFINFMERNAIEIRQALGG